MSLSELANKACTPCRGGVPPLKGTELQDLVDGLGHEWQCFDEHHLEKAYKFADWTGAIAFTNAVSDIAEAQDHHPDVLTSWGQCKVTIWTHKIDGLTRSDFFFAAKVEEAFQKGQQ
jgi:4a-hydroxytetrahydrobiopterin dehydratase